MTSNNIQAQGKVIRKLDEKEKEKLIVNVLNTPRDIISSEDNQTVTGRVNSLNQKTSNIFQSNVIQESSPSVTVLIMIIMAMTQIKLLKDRSIILVMAGLHHAISNLLNVMIEIMT
jgi:hypothetical protein